MAYKKLTGLTANTKQNLLLGPGIFFKNFNVATDTIETAIAAGKCLGATRGGGSFVVIPEYRPIEADGQYGRTKGLVAVDSIEVRLTANLLEITKDNLTLALGAVETDVTGLDHDVVTSKLIIEDADYVDSVVWIAMFPELGEPVIIEVLNVMNTSGLTLNMEDKNESVLAMELEGHFDLTDAETVPYNLYYPKK